jgi:hypothetical protein
MDREAEREQHRADALIRKGIPFEGETTLRGNRRNGSAYNRFLNHLYEVTVYPLMFGQYLLTTGRRDRDYWEDGYYYPDFSSAMSAGDDWDGKADPGHGWIRHVTMDERRKIEDEF